MAINPLLMIKPVLETQWLRAELMREYFFSFKAGSLRTPNLIVVHHKAI